MKKSKCITFDKTAQDTLSGHIKTKMKADRDKARTGQTSCYAYCMKSYSNEPLQFDRGYIESIPIGQRFSPNEHWRYATVEEIAEFFSTPTFKRPKGRYLAE